MGRRALVVNSRFPWPPITGDRGHTIAWLEALSPHADVTLVAPVGEVPAEAPPFRFVPARRSLGRLPGAAYRVLVEGLPATTLLAAGYDWSGALASAEDGAGPFDVAVILLARLDPWVSGDAQAYRRVLDAIDSLATNLDARALASRGPARWLWRWEARRTERLEAEVGRRYDRVLVMAEAERAPFGDRALAIAHGVRIEERDAGERDFDVGFWGRLAYFANRDAVAWLLDEIWPRIRAGRPSARLLIAGADAPRFVRRCNGRSGITVVTPMADRAALLRRVRVALLPMRFGSGLSTKVPEAAEASCALVATPEAVRGLDALAALAIVESEPANLASRTLELLAKPAEAAALGGRLRAAAEAGFSREAACRALANAAFGGPPLAG